MKPEIRYIEAMMKKHGMKSDETVMIGDTFESDMAIANAAGIDGIYLNSAGHDEKWIHEHNRTGAVVIEKIGELLKEPR